MKSKLLWLLLIPCAIFSGMGYGFLAHYLVRDKEPWFTFLLLGGLALVFGWNINPGLYLLLDIVRAIVLVKQARRYA